MSIWDNFDQDQVLSYTRTTIAGVSGWAIGKGYGDAQLWTMIGGVAGIIVPYVWGRFAHTSTAKLAAIATMPPADKRVAMGQIPDSLKLAVVEAMPDVQRIVVAKTATNGVAAAAADTSRPKVVIQ